MRFIAIIPSRYESSRFPGKPLADLCGKPMIQRVVERVRETFPDVVVATDDKRIEDAVKAFGGTAVMTSSSHKSGTDRVYEAYTKCTPGPDDVIINVQGDEPFITGEQLESIKKCFEDPEVEIATLARRITQKDGIAFVQNPNRPKVVLDKNMNAIFFSRSPIPFCRGVESEKWLDTCPYYKHIGLYAYKAKTLKEITSLEQGTLEKAESLEQLRWLENGYKVRVALTDSEPIGIDTPEDLENAKAIMLKNSNER